MGWIGGGETGEWGVGVSGEVRQGGVEGAWGWWGRRVVCGGVGAAEVVHMGGGSNNWRVGVMTIICRTFTFIFFVIAPNGQL